MAWANTRNQSAICIISVIETEAFSKHQQESMLFNWRSWPLFGEAVGPCASWWQYSQALPMLQIPLAMRAHGRLHKNGWPRLPLLSAPGSIAAAVGSGSIVCSVSPDGWSADPSAGRALISCTTACILASDLTDSDATYAASCSSPSCASCSSSSVFWFVPKAGQLGERDSIAVSIEESSSMKVLKYRKFAMPPRTVLCWKDLAVEDKGGNSTSGAKEGARGALNLLGFYEAHGNVSWRHQKAPRWKRMEKDETSTISMI